MADLSKFDQGLVAEYREAFALFDKDGDGCITTKDLGRDGRNQRSDKRSGSIDFSEFVALMETRKTEDELRSEIQETFKVFDRDQDGFISPLELRHVLSNLGIKLSEREAADMIAEADFNKDGLVDFEEFYRMMTARNAASKQRKVFHNCSKAFKKFRTIMGACAATQQQVQ
uniref:Calmodulin n=1 Tax=Macrostomum lignano TaxID=282301 RepID=A0A1I8IRJ3_9PLAT